jgi:hypothetical protein
MKLKYLIILFQVLLICQPVFSQKKEKAKTGWENGDDTYLTKLDQARFLINDIKAKGIIVRLKTDKERVAAYRRSGNNKVADDIEYKDKNINLLLMYSFVTQWSYCPLYFMEAQNTSKLILHDTLIAKTFDLQRDTSIYMDHDSFYMVDYGELMENGYDGDHPKKVAEESNNPMSGTYLVVKDHNLKQLTPPIPFHSKIWTEGFPSPKHFDVIELSQSLSDTMIYYLNKYHSTAELIKSEAKTITTQYLDSVYNHVYLNLIGASKVRDSTTFASIYDMNSTSYFKIVTNSKGRTNTLVETTNDMGETGSTLIKGTKRLNALFIGYYCIRLDKDKNILSRDDLLYWWQRNPNIRYLPYLSKLEEQLKEYCIAADPSHMNQSSHGSKPSSKTISQPRPDSTPPASHTMH